MALYLIGLFGLCAVAALLFNFTDSVRVMVLDLALTAGAVYLFLREFGDTLPLLASIGIVIGAVIIFVAVLVATSSWFERWRL